MDAGGQLDGGEPFEMQPQAILRLEISLFIRCVTEKMLIMLWGAGLNITIKGRLIKLLSG